MSAPTSAGAPVTIPATGFPVERFTLPNGLRVALVPFGSLLSTGAVDWGPVRQVVERMGTRVLRAAGAPGRDGLDPNAPRPESVEEAA